MSKTYGEKYGYLKEKDSWTDELKYVHRSRLLIGMILGALFGFITGISL